jgi:adenylate cyclase
MTRRLAAILFTDLPGAEALSQRDEGDALRSPHDPGKLIRPTVDAHRGHKIRSFREGLLIEFRSAPDAVECAIDLQQRIHELYAREAQPPPIRVGIHLGEVERRGVGILGDAVNIASRVGPLAEPGGICLTEPVYVQVRDKISCRLERLGPKSLRGIRGPIALYRVDLPWMGRSAPRPASGEDPSRETGPPEDARGAESEPVPNGESQPAPRLSAP